MKFILTLNNNFEQKRQQQKPLITIDIGKIFLASVEIFCIVLSHQNKRFSNSLSLQPVLSHQYAQKYFYICMRRRRNDKKVKWRKIENAFIIHLILLIIYSYSV